MVKIDIQNSRDSEYWMERSLISV